MATVAWNLQDASVIAARQVATHLLYFGGSISCPFFSFGYFCLLDQERWMEYTAPDRGGRYGQRLFMHADTCALRIDDTIH